MQRNYSEEEQRLVDQSFFYVPAGELGRQIVDFVEFVIELLKQMAKSK